MKGQVIKSTGSWYEVKAEDAKTYNCRLRGKFKMAGMKINNPLAVGDWVIFEEEAQGDHSAVISKILPRDNYIIRKSTRKTAFSHILAANIDQALLLATVTFPKTSLGFIDRFLVSAESFRIPSLVVFNKKDLLNDAGIAYCYEIMKMYEGLGYASLLISVLDDDGLDILKAKLKDKTTLIAGHSGVGKSTLLNALVSGLDLKTGDVSTYANKGTHTTTFAQMFEIDETSKLIDTPGIKELGLVDMDPSEISHYFPEMRAHLGDCKFNNCLHTNEPGCQVLAAFDEDKIEASRYHSYLSILEDYDSHR